MLFQSTPNPHPSQAKRAGRALPLTHTHTQTHISSKAETRGVISLVRTSGETRGLRRVSSRRKAQVAGIWM